MHGQSPPVGFDLARLPPFRMVLAEYDIVATGIETLLRRFSASPAEKTDDLSDKLRRLKQAYRFEREATWRFQVSDRALAELLMELSWRCCGADPLVALSRGVARIKKVLTLLSPPLSIPSKGEHTLKKAPQVSDNSAVKRDNLDLLAYELTLGRVRIRSAPLRHLLDVTSHCNFKCLTCYQSQTQEQVHYDLVEAPLGAIFSVFPKAQQVFVAAMGEPLLSRSAFDIVTVAKESGSYVELITNGTNLSRTARVLTAVDLLMVSVDGGTPETFDAIRRNGSFNRLRAALYDMPEDLRRKVSFNIVVCKQNVYSMQECIELAMELGIRQIDFHDMFGYLPWHDRMALDGTERAWFFQMLSEWSDFARYSGLALVCHLVRGPACSYLQNEVDRGHATRRSIEAVSDVPIPTRPRRRTLEDLAATLDDLLACQPDPVFMHLAESQRLLLDCTLDYGTEEASPGPRPDWIALREHVEAGKARFPHCMSTYAHLVVNGDGTTRTCCKVQNRMASIAQPCFDEIWNSQTYMELRAAHAQQIAPREECRNCLDPVRFHFLPETLAALAAHEIDVSLIRKPDDFPVPACMEDHPLVRALGSHVPP